MTICWRTSSGGSFSIASESAAHGPGSAAVIQLGRSDSLATPQHPLLPGTVQVLPCADGRRRTPAQRRKSRAMGVLECDVQSAAHTHKDPPLSLFLRARVCVSLLENHTFVCWDCCGWYHGNDRVAIPYDTEDRYIIQFYTACLRDCVLNHAMIMIISSCQLGRLRGIRYETTPVRYVAQYCAAKGLIKPASERAFKERMYRLTISAHESM